ncbi:unnamed protein product [Gordionus sp. m RMFG-2023]|uniref:proteasome inhibitor PI31 subunit-like isoform X2 n=1 Tax=Gordionus sp. m RMFG-2023 TaxID=3053472 RepID=UPI0030DF3B03
MTIHDVGFELFFNSVKENFKNKLDPLVLRLHWILLQNNLKCLWNNKSTELLPSDWNKDSNLYKIHYTNGKQIFEVKVFKKDNTVIMNLKNEKDMEESQTKLKTDEYISNDFKDFDKAYKNQSNFEKVVQGDLLEKGDFKAPINLPTSSAHSDKIPQEKTFLANKDLSGSSNLLDNRFQPPSRNIDNQPGIFPVGSGDLDPLGRSGPPGMLFDPAHNMGPFGTGGTGRFRPFNPNAGLPGPDLLPPGAIPPGARFDPFGPDITHETRPDHLRPPGSDDMYM